MDLSHALLGTLPTLARTAFIGVLGYAALVAVLRVSGRRTLAKMNAFDLVVTVALGSILASMLLSADVPLAQGIVAVGVLVALQFAITWTSVRVRWVRRAVTGEPVLVAHRGAMLGEAMRRARVHPDDVRAAVRAQGLRDFADVEAVVLETDGSFSVVERSGGASDRVAEGGSSLDGVVGMRGAV